MAEYIEREAARRMLSENFHRITVADEHGFTGKIKWSERVIYAEVADNVIAALPAADVRENVKGAWMISPDHAEGICSVCQYKIYGRQNNGHYLIVPYNYCPNCGADMRGGDEG